MTRKVTALLRITLAMFMIALEVSAQTWVYEGLGGMTIGTIRFSDQFVYACAGRDGLFRRSRTSDLSEWTFLGLTDTTQYGGGVSDVLVKPGQEDTLLAAVLDRRQGAPGILRSTDGGTTWRPSIAGFDTLGEWGHPVASLARTRDGSSTVFAGHFYYQRVYGSTNFGESWTLRMDRLPEGMIWRIYCGMGVVLAGGDAANFTPRLYRSTNGGDTWTRLVLPVIGDNSVASVSVSPFNEEEVVVVLSLGPVLVSHNRGDSWEILLQVDGTQLTDVVHDPDQAGHTFIAGHGLFETFDSGQHWLEIPPPQGELITALAWDRFTGALLAGVRGLGVFQYTPSGTHVGNQRESADANSVGIYPNPSRGDLSITLQCDGERRVTLQIWDVVGRLIHTEGPVTLVGGSRGFVWDGARLDRAEFPSGVYLLRFDISTPPVILFRKFVVVR